MSGQSVCPECQAGKHLNCTEQAWDHELDDVVDCQCRCRVKS